MMLSEETKKMCRLMCWGHDHGGWGVSDQLSVAGSLGLS